MRASRGAGLAGALLAVSLSAAAMPAAAGDRPGPANSILRPVAFADLPGWPADDPDAAFAAFRRSCALLLEGGAPLRAGAAAPPGLIGACKAAPAPAPGAARAFFESAFTPFEVVPAEGAGFLTGYYEPEVDGSLRPTPDFPWPLRGRPASLVARGPGEPLAGVDAALAAALRGPAGLVAAPDRAAIEEGALPEAAPLLHVRDEAEAFFIHVQGSARIRLPGGGSLRLAYAGRNGHAYTGIGRLLAIERGLAPEELTLEKLKTWLRAHPAEGRTLMRRNRSYIFFRLAAELGADEGPIGGAGVSLTPGRSLAVDRSLWSYGLPVFIAADVPGGIEPSGRIARLAIAQDTGSAIVGPARGDLFFGSGDEAGRRAGALRHPMRFFALLPNEASP